MKTLWMHGMGGSPNREKIAKMEEYGLTMRALHLDYLKESRRFEILREYCLDNQIKFLTGSSFGGFLGFWLSEDLGLPCLLLNPAVSIRGKKKTQPAISQLASPLTMVALGAQDELIDHERTLLFMEQDQRDDKKTFTRVFNQEGHGFTMEAFDEILKWALDLLQKHHKTS